MSNAMAAQGLEVLIAANIALVVGIALVAALRRGVRHLLGARLAFLLWLLPVIAVLGVLLPGPYRTADTVATPWADVIAAPAGAASTTVPGSTPAQEATYSATLPGAVARQETSTGSLFQPGTLLLAWFAGALFTTGVLFLRQWRFERLIRPLQQAPLLGRGVYRAVTGEVGAGLVGMFRPRIVVPMDFEKRFSPDEQQLVLDHEREHQRAGHAQLNALAALFQALFWLNPLVPLALRGYRLDQELACDAAVLARSGHSPRTYGQALLRAQQGALSPMGCAWRPPGGLHTRLTQLARRAPGARRNAAGLLGLFLLLAVTGGASWAARPDLQSPDLVAIEAMGAAPVASSGVAELQLRGLDGTLTVIVEDRDTPSVEGLTVEPQRMPTDQGVVWQVGTSDPEICQRGAPVSQHIVVRVPHGASVLAQGRMDARVSSPQGGTLHFEGCGNVTLEEVAGPLDLTLAGSVVLNGGSIDGDLRLRGLQSTRAEFDALNGDLRLQTSAGAQLHLTELNGSGTFSLSGGSLLSVEQWFGPLKGSVAGGSEILIEEIQAGLADFTLSGAGSGFVETGDIESLRVDQAARAEFSFGGSASTSHVRNRSREPVVLAQAGELDSEGLISTRWVPPDG